MTDRELLELAAKAAGIDGEFVRDEAFIQERWHFMRPYDNQNMVTAYEWNPLTDDGDALRLVVKLAIPITRSEDDGFVITNPNTPCIYELLETDDYAATRRAIVRAAAEIGKMKGEK